MQSLDFSPLVTLSVLAVAFIAASVALIVASFFVPVPMWAIVPTTAVLFIVVKVLARV